MLLKLKFKPNYINFRIMSTDHNQQNLYELPSCTICLSQLSQDLRSLNCGHVFHQNCIGQHFQYRGTCPNCQKRSHQKEIRMVIYPLTKNTQSANLMRQMLGNMSKDQKDQIQVLFKQVKSATEKNQKAQTSLVYAQEQLKKATNQISQVKTSYNRTKKQLQALKNDSIQHYKVIDHLHNEIKTLNSQNFDIRLALQSYKQKQSEYEKIKKIKRIMQQNSQSLIDYKNQLENNKTSPEQMCRLYFDMIMIRNLDVLKLKNVIESHPEKITEKQQEISKLKQHLQREKRQHKDVQEKRAIEKKKYEDLKVKYINLIQKYKEYKSKYQQGLSEQENYEDSMLSRPSFPLVQGSLANSNANNNKMMNSKEETILFNFSFPQNKAAKRSSSNKFDSIMQEQQSKQTQKNNQNQKNPIQKSLSSFVTQKHTFNPAFGSFGGIVTKKRAQDKKVVMKNIFG